MAIFSLLLIFPAISLGKKYKDGDIIPVYGNKVSPYRNSLETYSFYSIPFCPYTGPDNAAPHSIADAFLGNRLCRSAVTLKFKSQVKDESLCKVTLTPENINSFSKAIRDQYIYQLYADKLPIWAFIGTSSRDNKTFVFTRQHFSIEYSGLRVIEVNLTPEVPFSLEAGRVIPFSYTVDWIESNRPKSARFEKYYDEQFFKHQTRYYYLINSVVIVLLLVLLLIFVLTRFLGSDLKRFEREAELYEYEVEYRSDRGWKMLHSDVFRPPSYAFALSTFIGASSQVLATCIVFFIANLIFGFHSGRNSLLTLAFIVYTASSVVGGYFSGGFYKHWGGVSWIKQLICTALSIPSVLMTIEIVLSVIASLHGSSQAVRITSMLEVCAIVVVIVMPLTIIGGIVGRHWFFISSDPTNIGLIPRQIPPTPFYLSTFSLSIIIGILGASSIFMEIYYILSAIWQYKLYYVWSFLLIVALLLIIVIACASIVSTYFRLSAENYEWQWSSFISSCGVGWFIFAYCIYYYHTKTEMSGAVQTAFFFAYSTMLSLIVSIICGFTGFISSSIFVVKIYRNLKTD